MKKKKVILSFDYELFFGDVAGTVQKSLIEPTNKILNALEGDTAVFFVDYLMLSRLQAENEHTKKDFVAIVEQLKEIIRRGSRIELHLHPHWVDAKYVNGSWDFSDFSHYCLYSFPKEDITKMFIEGTAMLNKIAQDVDPCYEVCAFRAGGWAISPFDKIKEGFINAGLKIDSSVMNGMSINGYGYSIDFSNSPSDIVYHFEDDVMKSVNNGRLIEVQIGSYQISPFMAILKAIYYRFNRKHFSRITDGTHIQKSKEEKRISQKHSLIERFIMKYCFAIDNGAPFVLSYYLKRFNGDVCVFMGHPKDHTNCTCKNISKVRKVSTLIDYSFFLN